MKNLAAYTKPGLLPPYISVNLTDETPSRVMITVRGPSTQLADSLIPAKTPANEREHWRTSGGQGEIILTWAEFHYFCRQLDNGLKDVGV